MNVGFERAAGWGARVVQGTQTGVAQSYLFVFGAGDTVRGPGAADVIGMDGLEIAANAWGGGGRRRGGGGAAIPAGPARRGGAAP